MSGVGLAGNIAVVSRLKRLRAFYAAENKLTGNFDFSESVPGGGVGQVLPESLEIVDLHDNSLGGFLEGDGLFSMRALRTLRLSGNNFASETVPFEFFFSLSQLEILDLADNEGLKGYLPDHAPISPLLSVLDLSGVVLGIDNAYLNSKDSYISPPLVPRGLPEFREMIKKS